MDAQEFVDSVEAPRLNALERIREEIVIRPQQPDEFTCRDVEEEFGINHKTAEYRLKKLEAEGKLTHRYGNNHKGYWCRLYRWVGDNNK